MSDDSLECPDGSSGNEWEPNESDVSSVDSESDIDVSDHTLTESQFLRLSTLPLQKERSKSKVWMNFGHLARNGRVIAKCVKRYFCKICLENKILKRYVKNILSFSEIIIWICVFFHQLFKRNEWNCSHYSPR